MAKTVILGVIGSDAHVVGITILEQALRAAGFDVVNLGVQTSQEDFITAADDADAEAVLISSLYGHAEQDCQGFRERLDEADSDAYLSSNEAIRALNSDYITPIHHKYAFQRATEPTIDAVPTIYGTIDRGRFEPTAAAESDLSTLLSAEGTLVLKPVSEGRGDGVYVLEDGEQARLKMGSGTIESTVADLAADLDGYLVTEFLEQHDYAASIFPGATNTIRIHTLVDPETGEISLHRPSHRFGSRESAPIDNWSKGGYTAPIDTDTGEIGRLIALDGASRSRLRTHPETDARVAGVTVPYWAELRDLVREAAAIHRDAPLVGWDVVVTEDGPVLLEGNARPSIVGLQLTEGLLTDERLRRALEQA